MNCLEFSGIVRDYARQEWMNGPARAEAKLHLEECAACRDRFSGEASLDLALASLRRQDRDLLPPPLLRSAVMAEFDRSRPLPKRSVLPSAAWAARAAAVVVGALALAWFRNDTAERPIAPVVADGAREPHPAVVAPEPGPQAAPVAIPSPRRLLTTTRRPRTAPVNPSRERVTAFLPIGTSRAVDPREELRILRIQLPETELLRLGIPVAPRLEQGYVRADVLLGEDGLARAIRFVY